jgi:hypothetical protein
VGANGGGVVEGRSARNSRTDSGGQDFGFGGVGWFRTGLSEVRKVEVSETALGLSTGFGGKAGPPGFLKIGTEGAGNGPGGFWCERRRWGKRWIAKAAVLVQMGLAAVFG